MSRPLEKAKWVFVGSRGLRSGWRFLLYIVLFDRLGWVADWLCSRLGYISQHEWQWPTFFFDNAINFCVFLLAAYVLCRVRRESFSNYGLPLQRQAFPLLMKGVVWGIVPSVIIVVPLILLGYCSYEGMALHGRELVVSAAGWTLAFLALGFSEEFLFRGYALKTLAEGIGFWPAAVFLSSIFGLVHFLFKPNENWIDMASVALYGVLWSLMLRRTGSLWFPVGFHAASDYTDMIVFGEPNTGNAGQPIPGHLLDMRFHGPDWLTGGGRGTEASILVFAILAGLFYLFHKAYPMRTASLHAEAAKGS
jgi:hypothetical protein